MTITRFLSTKLRSLLVLALCAGDIALVLFTGIITFYLRHGSFALSALQMELLIVAGFALPAALHMTGAYNPRYLENFGYAARAAALGCGLAFLALLLIGYLSKTAIEISRIWVALWVASLPPLLLLERIGIRFLLARLGAAALIRRRIAFIGRGPVLTRLRDRLKDPIACGPYERFDVLIDLDMAAYPSTQAACQHIENDCRRLGRPDDFILAFPATHQDEMAAIVQGLRHHWANIDICPDHALSGLPFQEAHSIGGVPVFRVVSRPFEGWRGILKLLEDKLLTIPLLILAAPIMAVIALLIKLDDGGPVFFRQQRYGFGNTEITVLKFRTMFVDRCDDGRQQATRADPRITRLGRFLRRTSLDELPQLLNVLGGSMSLVGPRPHAIPHNLEFSQQVQNYWSRHRIRPGITGWAQVNGLRGEITDPSKIRLRVEHDLFYIENWSLWLDLVILWRTGLLVFFDRNAF